MCVPAGFSIAMLSCTLNAGEVCLFFFCLAKEDGHFRSYILVLLLNASIKMNQ